MNLSENARAACPYYKKITDREIQCEGCVQRARLVFVFRTKADAISHKREYCDTLRWSLCPYAQMLNEKYSGGWTHDFKRVEG